MLSVAAGAAGVAAADCRRADDSAEASDESVGSSPPNPKPMLLLRPRCLCAAVCRASKAESRGLGRSRSCRTKATGASAAPAASAGPASEEPVAEEDVAVEIRPRNRQPSSRTRSLRPPRLLALLSQPLLPVMSRLRRCRRLRFHWRLCSCCRSSPASRSAARRRWKPWPPEGFAPAGVKAQVARPPCCSGSGCVRTC